MKQAEEKRPDKNFLPIETFVDEETGYTYPANPHLLPYKSLDLIFNHKNIWANL
jgi:hypothetical protein